MGKAAERKVEKKVVEKTPNDGRSRPKTAMDAPRGTTVFMVDPDELIIITQRGHPLYDDRVEMPLDLFLVEDVMHRGVTQPIKVRKNGERDGRPVIEIVDGRQRTRAAREVNVRLRAKGVADQDLRRVPVQFEKARDEDLIEMSVALNEQRQANTPMLKAENARRLLQYGRTHDRIAALMRMPPAMLKLHLDLLDLCPEIQTMVNAGGISVSAAAKLAKLPREEQMGALKTAGGGKLTVVEVSRAVRSKRAGTVHKPVALPGRRDARRVVKRLERMTADETCKFHSDILDGAIAMAQWMLTGVDSPLDGIPGFNALRVKEDGEQDDGEAT